MSPGVNSQQFVASGLTDNTSREFLVQTAFHKPADDRFQPVERLRMIAGVVLQKNRVGIE